MFSVTVYLIDFGKTYVLVNLAVHPWPQPKPTLEQPHATPARTVTPFQQLKKHCWHYTRKCPQIQRPSWGSSFARCPYRDVFGARALRDDHIVTFFWGQELSEMPIW